MTSLDTAVYTIKDKITSTDNLAFHVESQARTNHLAIQGLTTDLELLKTDQDLHKDSYQETMGRMDKSVPKLQQLSLQPELRDDKSRHCRVYHQG